MKKIKASSSIWSKILTTAALVLLTRAALVLIFSLLAYSGSDPDSRISLFSTLCRISCELLCGFWVGRALSKDFSPLTRSLLAAISSLVLCCAETLVGKAMAGGGTVNVLLFVAAILASAIGGYLSARKIKKTSKKRRKRRA